MIDYVKLHRMEAELARMADARRSRSERYTQHITRSKELRAEAVRHGDPDFQTMPLNDLLAISDEELIAAGVDARTLRRAALERRLAEDERRTVPGEEAEFAALSTLVRACRAYAGEDE
jgi:hypothetical protein